MLCNLASQFWCLDRGFGPFFILGITYIYRFLEVYLYNIERSAAHIWPSLSDRALQVNKVHTVIDQAKKPRSSWGESNFILKLGFVLPIKTDLLTMDWRILNDSTLKIWLSYNLNSQII
jgi:hypothetical protein